MPSDDRHEMQQEVERLAEALILQDVREAEARRNLCASLEKISFLAIDANLSEVTIVAAQLSSALEKADPQNAQAFEMLSQALNATISGIQEIVCHGRSVKEVVFPPLNAPEAPSKKSDDGGAAAQSPAAAPAQRFKLPPHVDAGIFTEFLSRQGSVLEDIEALALNLEKDDDAETSGALKRIIHTIKGESALLGMADVERLCHETEDRMVSLPPRQWSDLLLRLKDWLARAFDYYVNKGPAPEAPSQVLLGSGTQAATVVPAAVSTAKSPAVSATSASFEARRYALPSDPSDLQLLKEFIQEAKEHLEAAGVHLLTLETDPENQEALNAVFRGFHTIKGVAGCLNLNEIPQLAHGAENLLDHARKGEIRLEGPAIDVTFDVADVLEKLVGNLASALAAGEQAQGAVMTPDLLERLKAIVSGGPVAPKAKPSAAPPAPKLGEILVQKGLASQETVDEALRKQRANPATVKLGEQLVKENQVPAKEVAQALRTQRATSIDLQAVQVKETIKVDADRLDRLVDMIGELVIAESMVSQSAELREGASAGLLRQLSLLDKITRELQESGTSLRMVPVRPVFQKMARLVRDLAKKVNKSVEFSMAGEDTELDKTVVEKISDPLVHMVRNAVDHGLEGSAEARVRAGKPETGSVELRAFHKGGNIYIEIEDDGRGLDKEAILAKAREKSLVREGDALSDRDIYNLIFLPGFSTAKVVTDVSGRGVGMDVVRRNIESLRGQVDIRSERGKGSVFTIRLPLTLAIIDGMVVAAGHERYIIPTLSILMSIRPEAKDVLTVLGRGEMLSLQGRLIPLFRLDRLFSIQGAKQVPTDALVIVVEADGQQAGLMADELLGQQQIVIKSLGEGMRNLPGISGGAIMPDGHVGLILDVSGLVRLAQDGSSQGKPDGTSDADQAA